MLPAAASCSGSGTKSKSACMAAGLNFRDVLNVLGMYKGQSGPLGAECAGHGCSRGQRCHILQPGDKVIALGRRVLFRICHNSRGAGMEKARGPKFRGGRHDSGCFLDCCLWIGDVGQHSTWRSSVDSRRCGRCWAGCRSRLHKWPEPPSLRQRGVRRNAIT